MELSVDIAADSHWGLNVLHVVLLREDLLGSVAQRLHLAFLNVLTSLQLLDPLVDIEALLTLLSRHYFPILN